MTADPPTLQDLAMSDLSFRAASIEHLPAIVTLLADDPLGRTREDARLPLDPVYVAAFKAIAADPNQLLIVADHDGAIVGCLQLSFIPGLSHKGALRGQIEAVRVAADIRNARIGRRMVSWAIEECRRRGCRIVQLSTTKSRAEAQRFYASLGFAATHEGMKLAL